MSKGNENSLGSFGRSSMREFHQNLISKEKMIFELLFFILLAFLISILIEHAFFLTKENILRKSRKFMILAFTKLSFHSISAHNNKNPTQPNSNPTNSVLINNFTAQTIFKQNLTDFNDKLEWKTICVSRCWNLRYFSSKTSLDGVQRRKEWVRENENASSHIAQRDEEVFFIKASFF